MCDVETTVEMVERHVESGQRIVREQLEFVSSRVGTLRKQNGSWQPSKKSSGFMRPILSV
jgi:hypothetical protein